MGLRSYNPRTGVSYTSRIAFLKFSTLIALLLMILTIIVLCSLNRNFTKAPPVSEPVTESSHLGDKNKTTAYKPANRTDKETTRTTTTTIPPAKSDDDEPDEEDYDMSEEFVKTTKTGVIATTKSVDKFITDSTEESKTDVREESNTVDVSRISDTSTIHTVIEPRSDKTTKDFATKTESSITTTERVSSRIHIDMDETSKVSVTDSSIISFDLDSPTVPVAIEPKSEETSKDSVADSSITRLDIESPTVPVPMEPKTEETSKESEIGSPITSFDFASPTVPVAMEPKSEETSKESVADSSKASFDLESSTVPVAMEPKSDETSEESVADSSKASFDLKSSTVPVAIEPRTEETPKESVTDSSITSFDLKSSTVPVAMEPKSEETSEESVTDSSITSFDLKSSTVPVAMEPKSEETSEESVTDSSITSFGLESPTVPVAIEPKSEETSKESVTDSSITSFDLALSTVPVAIEPKSAETSEESVADSSIASFDLKSSTVPVDIEPKSEETPKESVADSSIASFDLKSSTVPVAIEPRTEETPKESVTDSSITSFDLKSSTVPVAMEPKSEETSEESVTDSSITSFGLESPTVPVAIEPKSEETSKESVTDSSITSFDLALSTVPVAIEPKSAETSEESVADSSIASFDLKSSTVPVDIEPKSEETPKESVADSSIASFDLKSSTVPVAIEPRTEETPKESVTDSSITSFDLASPTVPVAMEPKSEETSRESVADSSITSLDLVSSTVLAAMEPKSEETSKVSVTDSSITNLDLESPTVPVAMEPKSEETPKESVADSSIASFDLESSTVPVDIEPRTEETPKESVTDSSITSLDLESPTVPVALEPRTEKTPKESVTDSSITSFDLASPTVPVAMEPKSEETSKESVTDSSLASFDLKSSTVPVAIEPRTEETPKEFVADPSIASFDLESSTVLAAMEPKSEETPKESVADSLIASFDLKSSTVPVEIEPRTEETPKESVTDSSITSFDLKSSTIPVALVPKSEKRSEDSVTETDLDKTSDRVFSTIISEDSLSEVVSTAFTKSDTVPTVAITEVHSSLSTDSAEFYDETDSAEEEDTEELETSTSTASTLDSESLTTDHDYFKPSLAAWLAEIDSGLISSSQTSSSPTTTKFEEEEVLSSTTGTVKRMERNSDRDNEENMCKTLLCKQSASASVSTRRMLSLINNKVDPCNDFHEFTCGGASINRIDVSDDDSDILGTDDIASLTASTPEIQKFIDFYTSCMILNETEVIEDLSFLLALLMEVDDDDDDYKTALTKLIAKVLLLNPTRSTSRILPVFDIVMAETVTKTSDAHVKRNFIPFFTLPSLKSPITKAAGSDYYERRCTNTANKFAETNFNASQIYEIYVQCLQNTTNYSTQLLRAMDTLGIFSEDDNRIELITNLRDLILNDVNGINGTMTDKQWEEHSNGMLFTDFDGLITELDADDVILDWNLLLTLLFGPDVMTDEITIALTNNTDMLIIIHKILNFFKEKLSADGSIESIKKILVGMLAHDLYIDFIEQTKPEVSDRKKFCTKLAVEMMSDVASKIYVERFNHDEMVMRQHILSDIFQKSKSVLINALESQTWLDSDHKKIAVDMVKSTELHYTDLNEFVTDDSLMNERYDEYDMSQSFVHNAIKLTMRKRKLMYRTLEEVKATEFLDEQLFTTPLDNKLKMVTSTNTILVPQRFLIQALPKPGQQTDEQNIRISYKLLHELLQIFNPINYKKEFKMEKIYEAFSKTLHNSTCPSNKFNLIIPNNMWLSSASRFSDDAALRLAWEYNLRHTNKFDDFPLPYANFDIPQLFYISLAQQFCSAENGRGKLSILLSESSELDNYFKVNTMASNSEEFAKHFKCVKVTNMNLANKMDQFPYLREVTDVEKLDLYRSGSIKMN